MVNSEYNQMIGLMGVFELEIFSQDGQGIVAEIGKPKDLSPRTSCLFGS